MLYQAGFNKIRFKCELSYDIEMAIWFPCGKPEENYHYSSYLSGKVNQNSTPSKFQCPLVMISSGFAGTMFDQSYLAEEMARDGYIVASISHRTNDKDKVLGCGRAWYRSYELKAAMFYLLLSDYAEFIDETKIALLGFSAGGFTCMPLVGANPQFQNDQEFLPFLNYLDGLKFSDLRVDFVKCLCLFAPALGQVFNPDELYKVKQHTLLLEAQKDEILGDSSNMYTSYLPSIRVKSKIKNAGHFVFNSKVSNLMKRLSPSNCVDIALPRENVHPEIINHTLSFLNKYLVTENYEVESHG